MHAGSHENACRGVDAQCFLRYILLPHSVGPLAYIHVHILLKATPLRKTYSSNFHGNTALYSGSAELFSHLRS